MIVELARVAENHTFRKSTIEALSHGTNPAVASPKWGLSPAGRTVTICLVLRLADERWSVVPALGSCVIWHWGTSAVSGRSRKQPKRKREQTAFSVSRHSYDKAWLVPAEATDYGDGIRHLPVRERSSARKLVLDHLGRAIVDHHFNQKKVANHLKKLGYEATALELRMRLPKDHRTRMGNFGEVVASEHLVQAHGYHMPVLKLRYRDHKDLPMRGEDILALKLDADGRVLCLCIGEAKAVKAFSSTVVAKAHARLAKTYHPRPETLSLVTEVLYERGEDGLAEELDDIQVRLASEGVPRDNWIFIISEEPAKLSFKSLAEMETLVENLHCVDLQLDGLVDLVSDLFEHPRIPRGK